MTIQDVQIAAAKFAESAGRRPTAIVSNQTTHDVLVSQLRGKPKGHQMSKWRIDNTLANDELRFD